MIDLTDTIPWDDICFIDCETRSTLPAPDGDVTKTSTRRYAAQAYPIIITWAFGLDGDVKRWVWTDLLRRPAPTDLPTELREWSGYFAAWNSGFDRAVLDRYLDAGVAGWLDMMAHAAYNNLPLGLDRAAKACGYEGKIASGKTLIRLFCPYDGADPATMPEAWAQFCEYADVDVSQMQAVAGATFPVPYAIWREFWASERINDRGLPVDTTMARGGARIAEAYAAQTNERVEEITDGAIRTVRQYDAQRAWVWERVRDNPLVAQHMVEAHRTLTASEASALIYRLEKEAASASTPATGKRKLKRAKMLSDLRDSAGGVDEYVLKMDRPAIVKMIAALSTLDETKGLTDDEFAVLQFLEEREYGASAAPAKFAKMVDMVMPDGTLPNQYVFGGATQTGRFSSRGVQVHNMTRDTVGDLQTEEDACLFLMDMGMDE